MKKNIYEKATRESNSMDCGHKILQIRVYNDFSIFDTFMEIKT